MLRKLPKVADCCVSGAVQEPISNSCRLSNAKMGKCVFNLKWTRTYSWVMKQEDKHLVKCKICDKDIALGKMGEAALRSHEKSDSHKKFSESDASEVSMDKFTVPPPPLRVPKRRRRILLYFRMALNLLCMSLKRP